MHLTGQFLQVGLVLHDFSISAWCCAFCFLGAVKADQGFGVDIILLVLIITCAVKFCCGVVKFDCPLLFFYGKSGSLFDSIFWCTFGCGFFFFIGSLGQINVFGVLDYVIILVDCDYRGSYFVLVLLGCSSIYCD